jgi:diguanylate cyclase (GGDEF)-like protein
MAMTPALAVTLREFARTMVTDFSREEILYGLVSRIASEMPVSAAGVTLITPDRGPRYAAASDAGALRFEQLQSEFDEGPCVQAYESGEACLAPDLAREGRFPQYCAAAKAAGLQAAFAFPLHYDRTRLGALDLYRTAPGPLPANVVEEAQILADVVSAYLVNAQAKADLRAAALRLQAEVQRDPLTGLANRGVLMDRLAQACRRSERSGRAPALLFLDLDGFKAINDQFGHASGDALLIAVGDRLSRAVRPADTVARLAGDEFAIICEDLEAPDALTSLIARITSAFEQPFQLGDATAEVRTSIGVALGNGPEDSPETLLRDADRDMYQNKRSGWSQRPRLSGGRGFVVPRGLHAAVAGAAARGELWLDYQPIVAVPDGHIWGVEALVRWKHPEVGDVTPRALIAVAEQTGAIVDVGDWILTTACAQLGRFQQHVAPPVALSVNVSARQLVAPGFADSVTSALEAAGILADRLTLELTGTILLTDVHRAAAVLAGLKALGVRLALDDFGTSESSLEHLLMFRADEVKIDRDFIADIGRDSASAKIVAAIIALAHDLDISTVGQGVETREQAEILTDLGADRCQGFHFAHPLPADEIDALLSGRNPNSALPPISRGWPERSGL